MGTDESHDSYECCVSLPYVSVCPVHGDLFLFCFRKLSRVRQGLEAPSRTVGGQDPLLAKKWSSGRSSEAISALQKNRFSALTQEPTKRIAFRGCLGLQVHTDKAVEVSWLREEGGVG